MGMLDRFADIIKANINDLLDKCEDPAKMIDQYLRDLTEDLAEVKQETAGVMAEETRTKRLVDENAAEVAKYDDLARKALAAGNEDDARTFLAKKQQLDARSASLRESYEAACANAAKMRQMYDKLVSDIEELNSRASGADKAADAMGAFARMEAKADGMLDRSNALSELNAKPVDDAAALEAKYAAAGNDAAVDDELARLKAEMGL